MSLTDEFLAQARMLSIDALARQKAREAVQEQRAKRRWWEWIAAPICDSEDFTLGQMVYLAEKARLEALPE